MERRLFERIGGFPPLRFMEDVFISKALRRHGRMVVLAKKILVSPRRWQRLGVIRQTLRNWALTGLAAAGVHPDRLVRSIPRSAEAGRRLHDGQPARRGTSDTSELRLAKEEGHRYDSTRCQGHLRGVAQFG